MKFLGQIKMEILNILRSRFLLIICILVTTASIVIPVLNFVLESNRTEDGGGRYCPSPAH